MYFERERISQTSDSRSLDLYWLGKVDFQVKKVESEKVGILKKKKSSDSGKRVLTQSLDIKDQFKQLYSVSNIEKMAQEEKLAPKNSTQNSVKNSIFKKKVIIVIARLHGSESLTTHSAY